MHIHIQTHPDLARVTTGKETPDAREREVKAFAHTWVAPLRANISCGRPLYLIENNIK
jgi:hypothetical protein